MGALWPFTMCECGTFGFRESSANLDHARLEVLVYDLDHLNLDNNY